jgi:hypothetical protein
MHHAWLHNSHLCVMLPDFLGGNCPLITGWMVVQLAQNKQIGLKGLMCRVAPATS